MNSRRPWLRDLPDEELIAELNSRGYVIGKSEGYMFAHTLPLPRHVSSFDDMALIQLSRQITKNDILIEERGQGDFKYLQAKLLIIRPARA